MPSMAGDEQWIYGSTELLHTPTVKAGFSPKVDAHYRALAVKRLLCLKDAVPCGGSICHGGGGKGEFLSFKSFFLVADKSLPRLQTSKDALAALQEKSLPPLAASVASRCEEIAMPDAPSLPPLAVFPLYPSVDKKRHAEN
ncbi:hypothetical protein P7C70_g8577, partial [Phenoliferia sp. Uapishka_3]